MIREQEAIQKQIDEQAQQKQLIIEQIASKQREKLKTEEELEGIGWGVAEFEKLSTERNIAL